jgi:hypothetical protein
VVDCKVFSRKGAELDERSKTIQTEEVEALHRNLDDEKRILNDERASAWRACWKAGNWWPTCTTRKPTNACSVRAPN